MLVSGVLSTFRLPPDALIGSLTLSCSVLRAIEVVVAGAKTSRLHLSAEEEAAKRETIDLRWLRFNLLTFDRETDQC